MVNVLLNLNFFHLEVFINLRLPIIVLLILFVLIVYFLIACFLGVHFSRFLAGSTEDRLWKAPSGFVRLAERAAHGHQCRSKSRRQILVRFRLASRDHQRFSARPNVGRIAVRARAF